MELPQLYPLADRVPAVPTVCRVLVGRFSPVERVKSVVFFSASKPASKAREWPSWFQCQSIVVEDTIFAYSVRNSWMRPLTDEPLKWLAP